MKDFFEVISFCELSFISDEIDLNFVGDILGIKASYSHKKGENYVIKHNKQTAIFPNHSWNISSQKKHSEADNIDFHLNYFYELLVDKTNQIEEIKKNPKVDIVFWIFIETEDAGIGLNISEKYFNFINKISRGMYISVIANSKFDLTENNV